MLKIRLQRIGRINNPSYQVVVTEHTSSPKAGKSVERVGSYNPKSKERILKEDRIKYWLLVGAQPSDTMHNMLINAGIISGKKINVLPTMKVEEKKEEPAAAEAPAAVPVAAPEPAAEAPAEAAAEAPTE